MFKVGQWVILIAEASDLTSDVAYLVDKKLLKLNNKYRLIKVSEPGYYEENVRGLRIEARVGLTYTLPETIFKLHKDRNEMPSWF